MESLLLVCALVSSALQVQAEGGCRVLDFLQCVRNKALVDHVIETSLVPAPGLEACQHKCFMSDDCVSYNLGSERGRLMRTCELSAFDHVTLPNKVVVKQGFEYCAIKNNPCKSNPCPAGKVCIPNFAWDTVKCKDGIWAQWGDWNQCTCPQTRNRSCENPFTGAVAADCVGPKQEKSECKAISPKKVHLSGCATPLGMENGTIKDAQITASSVHNHNACKARRARLNLVIPYSSAWCPVSKTVGEYLQVDLGSLKSITKVATQGRHAIQQWVTRYTLAYSKDRTTWVDYNGKRCKRVFAGNTDNGSVVTHELPVPIIARYIRLHVQKWNKYPSARVEFYGCNHSGRNIVVIAMH